MQPHAHAPARTAIRIVAGFDLLATVPLALPVIGGWWLALLFSGFGVLGAPAEWLPWPASTLVFCHLAGVLAVLWNGARFLRPERWLALSDSTGRVAVAALFVYGVVGLGASPALWLFVATELLGAAVQSLAARRMA